jgi:hypothetical protein
VIGRPRAEHISTSYVETSNLTLRMQQRRFTRLTNGFSKKLDNHRAAVSLYVAHYNLCRVHEALWITPAMASASPITSGPLASWLRPRCKTSLLNQSDARAVRVIDGGLA